MFYWYARIEYSLVKFDDVCVCVCVCEYSEGGKNVNFRFDQCDQCTTWRLQEIKRVRIWIDTTLIHSKLKHTNVQYKPEMLRSNWATNSSSNWSVFFPNQSLHYWWLQLSMHVSKHTTLCIEAYASNIQNSNFFLKLVLWMEVDEHGIWNIKKRIDRWYLPQTHWLQQNWCLETWLTLGLRSFRMLYFYLMSKNAEHSHYRSHL